MKKCYLVIFLLVLCFNVSWAQQPVESISINLKTAKLEQFVSELEQKSSYHFFYNPIETDSLRITLSVLEKPLPVILEQAFRNTDFHFAITTEHQVFITKNSIIQTSLTNADFNVENSKNKTTAITSLIDGADKQVIVATTENKLYEIGLKTNQLKQGTVTVSGYVKDIKFGEAVIGATVSVLNSKTSIATDQYGYYTITLPSGRQTLNVRGIGMRNTKRQLLLYSSGSLNIEMQEQITTLKEVQISADKVANVRSAELGVNRLDIKSIKQVPAVFGEADVLRVILTLPGVQSVGEATTGFNVRGGSADQNLILLNDATIYNPAHFFGFFSAFNPDIVKDVQLYKSSIPEKYGGRLSSVLEVTDREGNKKNFTGSAGIGLLTSRFNIEGPIIKDKTSFIFGGRTTYSDWLLKLLPEDYKHSQASFYDLNLDISHQINERNNLYITSYISSDRFKLNSDTAYAYNNRNLNIKWKHNFSSKLYSVFTLGTDHYQYNVSSFDNPVNAYKLGFDINQNNFKTDFTYYANAKHTVDFGLSSILYRLNPGNLEPNGSQSLVSANIVPEERALESAFYVGDKYDVSQNFTVNFGLRYSFYNYLGPQTIYNYAPGLPRESNNLLDSTIYKKNKVINTYHGPEIRLSARYNLADNLSVKAAYNTLRQYLHLLSNTTSISPTDVYKLSDPNIKPQYGDQVSLGLYHNLKANTIELS
ncbi:MAG: TonB-dependent receptor, partial [Sphingobacteriaceae bacterium]